MCGSVLGWLVEWIYKQLYVHAVVMCVCLSLIGLGTTGYVAPKDIRLSFPND